MRGFSVFITFAAALFIKVGDGLLFLILLLLSLSMQTLAKIKELKETISLPKLPRIPSLSILKLQSKKHSSKKKKRKKTKMLSLPFLVKLRYFFIGALFSLIVVGIPLVIYAFVQSIPNPHMLTEEQVPQTTKIYDKNHTLLYQIYALQNRTVVSLGDIPPDLQHATIAIEDKDFYTHPGFDILAIIRSFVKDLNGKKLQGGSTITQQLIKSALLTPETSITRKIKEVILAFWAERMYSKKQILALYFNTVPYGGTAWGAEAASEIYFGKQVKTLDLAQSAFLAGMPQAPTSYSPYGQNPTLWKKRQLEVLVKMQELGYIKNAQRRQAESEKLTFQTPITPLLAPHFVMYIRELLVQKYGLPLVEKGGLSVITTLDLKTQDMAQKIVTTEVQNDGYLNLTNGAALVTNPQNGDILAMVGSRDYSEPGSGAVNLTTSLRQPGSSIKIVTYATALMRGMTAASILDDSPITFSDEWGNSYSPVNYDGRFHGQLPLRLAFANSLNIPAVKTLNQVGIPAMVSTAKDMGITTWGDPSAYGLSLTLGAGEVKMTDMAEVFGTVANMGDHVALNPFLKITDSHDTVLEEKKEIQKRQVLSRGVAFILGDILADNTAREMEFGPNSPLVIPGHYVSVKTGTTDSKRDNWTIGFTKDKLTAVWVGNNDNTPMSQNLASGITGAAPIWHQIMQNLLTGSLSAQPPMPSDVVSKPCLGHMEYFVKGTENSVNCGFIPYASQTPPRPR